MEMERWVQLTVVTMRISTLFLSFCSVLPSVHVFARSPLPEYLNIELVPAKTSTSHNSLVQFISGTNSLDGPKIGPVNDTVFDWWYFDAVAADGETSIVVTFFTSTSDA